MRVPTRASIAPLDLSRQRLRSVPMRREFSAGGVLVRRLAGPVDVARSGRRASPGHWVLPKGQIDPGERGEAAALREVGRGDGRPRPLARQARGRAYWFNWEGERVFKVVSFFLVRYAGGRLGDIPEAFRHEVAEARWLPLDEAPTLLAYSGEREMARKAAARLAERGRMIGARCPRSRSTSTRRSSRRSSARNRKTATIRLGDKSRKYQKGMIVSVLVGARYGPRQHVFDAVIDKVEVKALARALAARDRARQPRDAPPATEMAHFLEPALQPRGHRRGHRHRDPLLGDQGASSSLAGLADRHPEERARGAARRTPRSRRRRSTRTARSTRAAVEHRAAARGALGGDLASNSSNQRRAAPQPGRSPSSRRAPCGAPRGASRRPCPRGHCSGRSRAC